MPRNATTDTYSTEDKTRLAISAGSKNVNNVVIRKEIQV
jgi:hypothetical protein